MTPLDDALADLRAINRAKNAALAREMARSATDIEQAFGLMLDTLQELAASVESPQLLGCVDRCRAVVDQTVRGLRAGAQTVRD